MTQLTLEVPEAGVRSPVKKGEGYGCETCGVQHTRITSMIDACMPKHALVPWAERVGREGALSLFKMRGGDLPTNPADLQQALLTHGLDCTAAKESGGDRGAALHDWLEDYATTGQIPLFNNLPEEYQGYGKSLAKFLADYEPEFLASEFKVVHHELDYAGRCDGIAIIHKQPARRNKPIDLTGKKVLFDLKSNKDGRVYPDQHFMQTAGYELALRDMSSGELANDHQLVVAIGAAEKYQAAVSYFKPEVFAAMAHYYSALKVALAANPNKRSA